MTGLKNARWFEAILIVLLIVLTCTLYIIIVSTPPAAKSWEMADASQVDHMMIGGNDTLYTFSGNEISAIDKNGSRLWNVAVPGQWKVLNNWTVTAFRGSNVTINHKFISYPLATESEGHLYVYALRQLEPNNRSDALDMFDSGCSAAVIAISPQGKIDWVFPLLSNITGDGSGSVLQPQQYEFETMANIGEHAGRIYVFSDYTEYVLSEEGQLLFNLANVSNPAAVDEQGNLYLNRAVAWPRWNFDDPTPYLDQMPYLDQIRNGTILVGIDPIWLGIDIFYRIPSGTIDSYDRDGRFLWSQDIGQNMTRQSVVPDLLAEFGSLPLYQNGSVYVPVSNGAVKLDTAGDILWTRQFAEDTYIWFEYMPLDSDGNVYLRAIQANTEADAYSWDVQAYNRQYNSNWWEVQADIQPAELRTITADGQEFPASWQFAWPGSDRNQEIPAPAGCKDGVVYAMLSDNGISKEEFQQDLVTKRYRGDTLMAYDAKSGTLIWNFTVPDVDVRTLTFSEDNYRGVASRYMFFVDLTNGAYFLDFGTTADTVPLQQASLNNVRIYPGANVTYVYYDYDLHQQPVIFNRSKALYVRELYALDDSGRLLWKQPLAGSVATATASNGTFYYTTDSGKLIGGSGGIAVGVAIAVFFYLCLRFFVVGTVSRARNRLDKNENRNLVLKYVVEHPGATARDIERGLNLNFGTLRYHLFILAMNHKILAHGDDKYQRYFTNSNTYSDTDRALLSLMRRDPVKKTLQVLIEKPGITGQELQKELNLSMTATHKHVSLLVERGIVDRVGQQERSYAYSIKNEYLQHVTKFAEQF